MSVPRKVPRKTYTTEIRPDNSDKSMWDKSAGESGDDGGKKILQGGPNATKGTSAR